MNEDEQMNSHDVHNNVNSNNKENRDPDFDNELFNVKQNLTATRAINNNENNSNKSEELNRSFKDENRNLN
jgi:hypothetical protein